ncbi:hypothetical protein GT147_002400 [Salmonella enterica]|nr:hypothetical protein [Salmonella enterica subsp. enterica serovar Infantis]EDW6857285.1 hypothetical protein [Salmonella enterica]EEJ5736440.1 hypothetical protein [Salmonella enterica]
MAQEYTIKERVLNNHAFFYAASNDKKEEENLHQFLHVLMVIAFATALGQLRLRKFESAMYAAAALVVLVVITVFTYGDI